MPQEIGGEGSEILPLCRNRMAPLLGGAEPEDQPEGSPHCGMACHCP